VPPGLRRFEPAQESPPSVVPTQSSWSPDVPAEGRAAAERAVNAALAPRFTSLRADGTDTASFPVPSLGDPGRPPAQPVADSTPLPRELPPTPPPPKAVTGPLPVYGAPVTDSELDTSRPLAGGNGGYDDSGVVIPPAGVAGEENRLPIFESVESDWVRRGRHGADRPVTATADAAPVPAAATAAASSWTSPADAGWQAAAAAAAPAAGGTTKAGLPKRVPRANLVPGTVSAEATSAPAPVRSASITRDRFASFQRGVREARAAAVREGDIPGEEDSDR
jgi:hypothetical protein